jgi:hypothetical protein
MKWPFAIFDFNRRHVLKFHTVDLRFPDKCVEQIVVVIFSNSFLEAARTPNNSKNFQLVEPLQIETNHVSQY